MTFRLIITLALILITSQDTHAGEAPDAPDGTKHAIAVSVRADPKIAVGVEAAPQGTLTLLIRVSSHSQRANFSGEITVPLENINLNQGSPLREAWNEPACHERRGLPRIWIERLQGEITQGQSKVIVRAEPRRLGVPLPQDELRTEQRVETAISSLGTERISHARSLQSHLLVEVRLLSIACAL